MEPQDFLMKQIQRVLTAILRRFWDLVIRSEKEDAEGLAREVNAMLEQLSGLDADVLAGMDAKPLVYLLNLRCKGETKWVMAEVLRFQTALTGNQRWKTLAEQLEMNAQDIPLSRATAELLKKVRGKIDGFSGQSAIQVQSKTPNSPILLPISESIEKEIS